MAKFSDLPQELRDIIWKFAIRPEGPTAHYFSVHHSLKDDHLVEPQWSIGTSIESFGHDFYNRFVFAAPRCGRDGSFSWVLGNYSTYMEDSALWTTCRDSRSHMIQRFRPHETNRRISREHSRKAQQQDIFFNAATVTAVLQRDGGERQYFTIQPMKDLIIIQTLPGSCISWDRNIDNEYFPPIDNLWEELPLHTFLAWSSQHGVYCEPENIAINFNPTWLDQPEKYIRKFHGALNLKIIGTLWFVDDRLQRDLEGMRLQTSLELQKDKKVFNAMGRRFVEVHASDPGWVVAAMDSDGAEHRAFDFVQRLKDLQFSLSNERDEIDYASPFDFAVDFGVLACELL